MNQEVMALTAKMFYFITTANEELVREGRAVIESNTMDLAELAKANGKIQGKAEVLDGMASLLKEYLDS